MLIPSKASGVLNEKGGRSRLRVVLDLPDDLSEALARAIAETPDEVDEAEAVRRIMRDWFISLRYLPPDRSDA